MPDSHLDQLLTLPQVCELLQLSSDAVRRAIRAGDLPAHKLGGRLRFRPLELEAYIDARRIQPAPTAPRTSGEIASAPSAVPPRVTSPISFRERARRADQRDAA